MEEKITIFNKYELINPWWRDDNYRFKLYDRDYYLNKIKFENISRSINILIGARRVGKTSIMRQLINSLLNNGVKPNKVFYLTSDFFNSSDSLLNLLVEYFKLTRDTNGPLYILIDEVQDIVNWQKDIKFVFDNLNVEIVLSGSSSLLLKSETSKLTGRYKLIEVLGLSFNEFLQFKKYSKLKAQNHLEEYLQSGGYPEYVNSGDAQKLMDTIDSTMYRDLLSVYGIRNPAFLRDLLEYLSDKVGNPISPNVLQKQLKVDDTTIRFYLKYLQDVYLIYPVYKKGMSNRITKSSLPKYYFNDNGTLFLLSLNKKIGSLAENAVYIHLRRKAKQKEFVKIYYFHDENVEVDFYAEEEKNYYEVKYRTELATLELEKYALIDESIKFLVREKSELFDISLPLCKQILLSDFLLSE